MTEIEEILNMYPDQTHLWRTSDSILHLTEADAKAQARHLANGAIEKIACKKTRKVLSGS